MEMAPGPDVTTCQPCRASEQMGSNHAPRIQLCTRTGLHVQDSAMYQECRFQSVGNLHIST